MRRFLIALMTLMVAVQFSWAAAAGYCAHETTVGATTHFGHHAHAHLHDGEGEGEGEGGGGGQKLQPSMELDHGHCHLVHAAMASSGLSSHALPGQVAPSTGDTCLAESHIPDGLDRPNWQRA